MTNGKGKNNRKRFVPLEVEYINYSFAKKDPVYTATTSAYADAARTFTAPNPTSTAMQAPTVYAPQPVRNDNLSWAARMARPASKPEPCNLQPKPVSMHRKAATQPTSNIQGSPSTDIKTDSVDESPKSTITRNWSDVQEESNAWGNASRAEAARDEDPPSIKEEPKPLISYEIIEPEEWTEGTPWQPTISRLVLAPELLALSPAPRQASTFYKAYESKSSFNDNNAGYMARRKSNSVLDSWLCYGCEKYYAAGWYANDDQWYCTDCHWSHDNKEQTPEKAPKRKTQGSRKTYYVKKVDSTASEAV